MVDDQAEAASNQELNQPSLRSDTRPALSRGWADVAGNAAIGALCGILFSELSFSERNAKYIVLIGAVGCAILSRTRLRRLIQIAGATVVGGLLIIGLTPVVPSLLPTPAPADLLEPCDAVVSLGSGLTGDGMLTSNSQDRIIHALSVMQAHYAPTLVLTGGEELGESVVLRQMQALGLKFRAENVGHVTNTHDEAVAVSQLARERGWNRVILVTNRWHMKRAAAVFEKAGIHVLRSPCPDSRGDMEHPSTLTDRIRALACWLHESLGYRVYRGRGWI